MGDKDHKDHKAHAQVGVVIIEVVEGKDLVAMDDNGLSDPYVCCIVGAKKKKTKIIRDTLNPKWTVGDPEVFKFKVRKNVDKIILECYDWDRAITDDRMGMVIVPLEEIRDEKLHDKWQTLVPMNKGDPVSGQLHFKIQFTSVITAKHQKNPLVIAIKAGDAKKVGSLLSSSSTDPNSVDAELSTPLHLAAVGANHKILDVLLHDRKVVASAKDKYGNTPLHIFAQKFTSPNCEDIIALFVERGVDINVKNSKLETPLHKACLNVSVKVVMAETLLKRGADCNVKNTEGDTPMDYSIKLGREDLCELLVSYGAFPNFRSQVALAESLKFFLIAEKLRVLTETFEWFQKIGLDKVGATCVKKHITKDQLSQLKDSDLDKLGFASKKEKDTFQVEAGKIMTVEEKRKSFKQKMEKADGKDPGKLISSLKYSKNLATQNWEIDYESLEFLDLLGKGAYGQVHRGLYGDQKVAIKSLSTTDNLDEFVKEFQIICYVHAPNIVKFHGACLKPLCIVMELCEQGSLHHVLARPKEVGWADVFRWALGTVKGIHSLHHSSPPIMHRDLKSLNVLVTADGTAKVCDFGLSRFDTSSNMATMAKLRGTYHYVAPELYLKQKFTFASDVYSIGIILWELVNRCITKHYALPFSEFPNLTQDFQVLIAAAKKDVRPTIPPTCPSPLKEFIMRCYSKNSADRPSTQELIDGLTAMEADFAKDPTRWNSAIVSS